MSSLIITLVTLCVTSTIAQEDFETFRLPNNTRPENYDISIRTWIDEANWTFTGSVRIGIVAVESTDFIRLHHNVQRLESVRVLSANEEPVSIGEYSYNRSFLFLTIPIIGSNLTQGTRYFIDIDYVGSMNADTGFYRSSYVVNGTQVWFGSTQFEPTDARRAFPCYDEPALRVNFTIRITHVSTYEAISNMPVRTQTSNPDGSVTTEFETTPIMPTYLVAFHISDFPHVTSSPPRSIPQRIFARSTAINTTDLALDAGELLIDAFSKYIGIEYSLPKMDQAGVPGEYFFLFDENVDFFTRAVEAVQTISHELAHQWFGNLLTPSWWTYLWMKVGFASFFEVLGIDLVYPEWRMMDFFVTDVKQYVFYTDANEFSRLITYYVEHPDDIDDHYDSIAYLKAGSVLRMFWHMFGEDTFMQGVKWYLEDNAYSNASEEQLFEALDLSVWLDPENVIPPTVNVPTIMATCTNQAGFPLITVERNYDDRTEQVTLRQERYYAYPQTDPENTTWWVPYNLATPNNPGLENTRAEGWIPPANTSWEITVNSLGPDDYLLINKMAAGYYRVMYDERNYRLISDAILRNSSQFHPTDIATLQDDAFDLYRTNGLAITSVLDLLRVLEFDSDFISWSPAFFTIFSIDEKFRGHQNYPIWAYFVRSLTEELYYSVGIEDIPDEPVLRKYSREVVVGLACQMGSVHCRSDATRQLRQHIETGEDFHQNIKHVLMCASLRSASRTEFQFMWNRLISLPLEEYGERSTIIEWLGCHQSRPMLIEFIRSSLNSTNSNDVEYGDLEQYAVYNSIIRNGGNLGLDVALRFLNENAVEALETYGYSFVYYLAYMVSREDHIDFYLSLQNTLREAGLIEQETIDYHMTIFSESVTWLRTEGELINNWLMENFS